MPKLRKFDELEHQLANKADVEAARAKAESVVTTRHGPLQFDLVSRQRMQDVLRTLNPAAKPGEEGFSVSWTMADNSVIDFSHTGLRDIITEAEALAGPRAIAAFQKAQGFKATLEAGGELTMRDIAPENW